MKRIAVLLTIGFLITNSNFCQEYLDWNEYNRLWQHVLNMPESEKESSEKIIEYLKKATNEKRKLIEIIYYWMSDNIEYDIEEYLSDDFNDNADILKTRKSVCEGYSDLFKQLCEKCEIECAKISGFSKGYGYTGEQDTEPSHAWNAVKLYGEWKLIDSTWGSGYVTKVNDSLVYEKNLNLGYLFSRPEGFIIEHFPEDPKWQLLKDPITKKEFYSTEMDKKMENIYEYLR